METPKQEPTIWDVPVALGDVCFEMLKCHADGVVPDVVTVRQWHQRIYNAAMAHNALALACEKIVEDGATPERVEAMKVALTHAMGQSHYWPRRDRW